MSRKALYRFVIIAPILPNRSAVQQHFAVVELLTELQKRKCIKEQISKSYDKTTYIRFWCKGTANIKWIKRIGFIQKLKYILYHNIP